MFVFNKLGSMLVVVGDDEGIKFINIIDVIIVRVLKGYKGLVISLVFDFNNEYLVFFDIKGIVIFWEF